MTDERLYIEGLKEFRAALREVAPQFAKELQKENKKIAQEVVPHVQAAYDAIYTSRSGRGRASIRALASQTTATIAIGGARTPYMVGQEFGSYGRYPQFTGNTHRGGRRVARDEADASISRGRFTKAGSLYFTGAAGRFLYPTLRAVVPELLRRYLAALDRVSAFAAGKVA